MFKKLNRKKCIVILVFCILLFLFFYLRSFYPKELNLVYDGVKFKTNEYHSDDLNTMECEPSKIYIIGKLHKPWFKEAYFEGYIYTDFAPIEQTKFFKTRVSYFNKRGQYLMYYDCPGQEVQLFATTFIFKNMKQLLLQYNEESGYKGWSVLAPATDVNDVIKAKKYIEKHDQLNFLPATK